MAVVVGEDFNYTYNGTLLTEVFFKPSTATPALSDMFRIIPGSDSKIQIPTLGNMSKIIAAGDNCNRVATGTGIDLGNQTVTLSKVKMYMEQCSEEFEGSIGNILAEEFLKDGNAINDIGGTQIQSIINRVLEDALRRDIFNLVCFGDSNDADAFYGIMDGYITTLLANDGPVGGSGYCVQRAADLGTGALAADAAITAMEAAYNDADSTLDQIPENQKYFQATRSVFNNLLKSYESTSTGSDLQVTMQMEGVPNVRYRGVPVKKISEWDNALSDAANPLNGTVEHLLVYTTKENHVLGVQNQSDLNKIDGWYSKDDDVYKFASKMRAGYNYVHCDQTVIAY